MRQPYKKNYDTNTGSEQIISWYTAEETLMLQ